MFHYLFLLFFLPLFNTQENSIVVEYQLSYQYDKENSNGRETISCILLRNKNVSKFCPSSVNKLDSLKQFRSNFSRENYIAFLGAHQQPKLFDYRVIKNFEENSMDVYTKVDIMTFVTYKEVMFPMKWKLCGDTKTIKGYECHSASTQYGGREYLAWYTADIPVPDGPYKFGGLPGLILELQDLQDHYRFQFNGIWHSNEEQWLGVYEMKDIPIEYEQIRAEEIIDVKKSGYRNLAQRLPNMGYRPMDNAEESYSHQQAVIDTYNNHIERAN